MHKGLLILGLLFLVGCAGWIEEGQPPLRNRFPRGYKVQLLTPVNGVGNRLHARGAERVEQAFVKALDSRGIRHSVFTNGCDITLAIQITHWEYGDEGFSGAGNRDSVYMDVWVRDIRTGRIKTRSSLEARKLDELVDQYVDTLFLQAESN